MRIKEGFVLRMVGDRILAVATGSAARKFNGMITLNKSGEFLWKQLETDKTVPELIEAMTQRYDVTPETAREGILAFVEKLRDAGIIAGAD